MGDADAPIATAATCEKCLSELFDPSDRRFRYPFVNCADCGPWFTIVRRVPYDRGLTTMAGFEMCRECRAEYEDPGDRRFHAQANACRVCGPRLRLLGAGAEVAVSAPRRAGALDAPDAVKSAARLLADGAIVAVKGPGGYQLVCRADDEAAAGALRARKRGEERPFALMVADLAAASQLVQVEDEEEALLQAPARPIVLAPRLSGAPVARSVAPRARELGVMLARTSLHHLLLGDLSALRVDALVVASGNADEPIAYEDEDAVKRLGQIADAFLVHDRPIQAARMSG